MDKSVTGPSGPDDRILRGLLDAVSAGTMTVDDALAHLQRSAAEHDFAHLDHLRAARTGFPEVIYCSGKSSEQIAALTLAIAQRSGLVLATRADARDYDAVRALLPEARFDATARTIVYERTPLPRVGATCIVSAGTADRPVAAEAHVALEVMGNNVARIDDVGVAGLHRVLGHVGALRTSNVIIAVAGMDGALPGVVAGLTNKPVIAVPTSVGYGASFGGLAALLTMLNACAGGVGVVNIDNGFGAACLASRINHASVTGA